jgi:ribose/xylose/arabinose/galactoside ABC-type transport system permease subunit
MAAVDELDARRQRVNRIRTVAVHKSIALLELQDTTAGLLFSGQLAGFPVQIFWALGFVAFAALLFNRHRFGARVHAVGDNPDSAGQMGINVTSARIATFVFMGLGAALAGVFSTMAITLGGRPPATAISCRRSLPFLSAARRRGAASARSLAGRSAR